MVCDSHVGEHIPALPSGVADALGDVDLILHGGDLTDPCVVTELERIAPVVAVRGNHDHSAGSSLPWTTIVRIGGRRIGLVHGVRPAPVEIASALVSVAAGRPVLLGLLGHLRRRLPEVECIVFGHLHLPVQQCVRGVLMFSPGAVYVPEVDPERLSTGPTGWAYMRYRKGIPTALKRPMVGILEVSAAGITARSVPVLGGLRGSV